MLLLFNGLGLMLMPRAMCRRNAMITAESRAQCAAARAPPRRFDVPRRRLRNDARRWRMLAGPCHTQHCAARLYIDPLGCSVLGTKPLRMTTHTLRDRILARV